MSTLEQAEANVGTQPMDSETAFVEDIVNQEPAGTVEPIQQEQGFVEPAPEETISIDYESEAKKFQSMYDRAQSENQKLSRLEPLAQLLETRPDLVQKLQDGIANQQSAPESQPGLSEDDFNPWEAFTKPGSQSNQYVSTQMQQMAGEMIQNAMAEQQRQMQADMYLNNTMSTLRDTYKMSDNDIKEFMEFSTQPTERVGLGNLVKLWRDVNGNSVANNDTVEAVSAAKQAPRTAGVLQGQAPESPKTDQDKVWDSIMSTGSGTALP